MKERVVNEIVKKYLIITVIICFVGRVMPIRIVIGDTVDTVLQSLLALSGAVLLVIDFFTTKKWYKGKYSIILYVFIGIMLISSVINMKYGIINNLKTIVWTTIDVGIIYSFYTRCSKKEFIDFFRKIFKGISVFWLFPVLISLIQFVLLAAYTIKVDGGRIIRQGFYDNRLFGIFNDPNYAAVISLYVIIAAVYFYKKCEKRQFRFFWVLNIIFQVWYIVLSGSRTAQVCMIALLCVILWSIWKRKTSGLGIIKRGATLILIPVFSFFVISISAVLIQNISIALPVTYQYIVAGSFHGKIQISDDELDSSLTKRKDTGGENISNNRTTIWKAYIRGMKGDVLLGGSPRNVLIKWQEKDKDGYLAVTEYETHNGYLLVLVGTGVLGFLTLCVYISLYAKKLIGYLIVNERYNQDFMLIISVLVVLIVYAFFFTEIFFIHNLTSTLFWLSCGGLMLWLDDKKEVDMRVSLDEKIS